MVALAVRIAAIEAVGAESIRFGDAPDYIATARSVCTEQVYPERGNLPFFRPPGLPLFIAGVTVCDTTQTRIIKYALAACDAATVVVVSELAWLLLSGSALTALLAGATAALYPLFVSSTTDVRSEPLFMLLLTLAILLLLKDRPAAAGVATALAALTRPTALLCIPLFALYAGRKKAAPLVIASLLTLAPWVARNYLRFGEIILVNDAGSYSVWHASHAETRRIYEAEDRAEFKRREAAFEQATIHEVARQVEARATTPGSRDREWRRLAIEELRRDPRASVMFAAKKAWLYWRPWLNPIEYRPPVVAVSAAILLSLFGLAAFGMTRHPDKRLVAAVLLYFAVIWLAHVPHQVVMRYRIPFTDPLLLVFAAGAISWRGRAREDADSRSRSAAT